MHQQTLSSPGIRVNTRKLRPSYDAAGKVERSRIFDLVDHSNANLVLVTAPAGYGKTTTLSQLYCQMRTAGRAACWLTVDASDDDLGRFTFYLRAALASVLEAVDEPESAGPGLDGSTASSARVQQLLETLDLAEAPFVLFIDEFEEIGSTKVLQLVSEIVAALSPGQQIVLGSRQTPDLPLGRLRVSGRLLEIDADLLKFDREESRLYIAGRLPCFLNEAELDTLQHRTDGWPAALQLAAAALTGRSDTAALLEGLAASSRNISDYLAEDVLARLPPRLCDFLLTTSLFDAFSPAMCDAALEVTDSRECIAATERDNLFLQRIDNDGPWYRYHPLFREFLSTQLRHSGLTPERIATLQLNAARWLANHDRPFPAVPYALAAGDHALAADIMSTRATALVRVGQFDTVAKWVAAIPDAILATHANLLIAGAYATTFLHRYGEASRLIELLPPEAQIDEAISAELVALRIMLCAWSDRLAEAFRIGESARARLAVMPPYVAGLIHNALAYEAIALGSDIAAMQEIAAAKRLLEPIGAVHALNYSVSFEGAIALLQGEAKAARARFEGTLEAVIAGGHRYTTSTANVAAHLAETLYELNEIDAAETLLIDYLPVIHDGCLPDHIIVAYRVLARIQAQQGQYAKALVTLDTLQDLGDVRSIPRISAASRIDKHRLALLAGDVAAAQRMAPLIADASVWQPSAGFSFYSEDLDDPLVSDARLALVEGSVRAVIPRLQDAICEANGLNRRRRVARLQCLLAQAFEIARRRPQALETLERALVQAEPGGMLRVFADEPWHLHDLLQALADRKCAASPGYLQNLRAAATRTEPVAPKGQSQDEAMRLSPKEGQILRLLAEGHSNKELARKLFVTENTVETHLRRIYGKLGIRSRTQAVARALELGLI
ncbi:Serine/threonine-protein kinase PknK [Azoarcus sp. Aa7]|nr:Serine/threonine-protein kinase PknK [Azoarcus sp. Aa7]